MCVCVGCAGTHNWEPSPLLGFNASARNRCLGEFIFQSGNVPQIGISFIAPGSGDPLFNYPTTSVPVSVSLNVNILSLFSEMFSCNWHWNYFHFIIKIIRYNWIFLFILKINFCMKIISSCRFKTLYFNEQFSK